MRLQIEQVLRESWHTYVDRIGPLVGAGVIVVLLSILSLGILGPPLAVGIHILCLRAASREEIRASQVFDGLRYFWSSWGAMLLLTLLAGLAAIACCLPAGILAAVSGDDDALMAASIILLIIGLILLGHILLAFAPPLVLLWPALAEGRGAADALGICFRDGFRNWPSLFVLWLLIFVANTLVSNAAAGLGWILTYPWSCAVRTHAYIEAQGDSGTDETTAAEQ